jgi:hypothetical protein
MELKDFAVNLIADVSVFYNSLFDEANVEYRDSLNINAPVVRSAPAIIEARLKKVENKGNRFRLESEPVNVEAHEPIKLINRAEAIVIESLILATRLPNLPGSRAQEALRENYRVVRKTAPGSQYEGIMEKLVEALHGPASGESPC